MVAGSICLPPSERDFEVYQLTVVEGLSTRDAARMLGVSQTRVIQLRDRVREWIARRSPDQGPLTKEERLRAAEYAAGEQLQFLYATAIDAWQKSCGEEVVTRRTGFAAETTTKRASQGKVCYLNQAMRIAALLAKLPQGTLPVGECVREEANPPVGDCSPRADLETETADEAMKIDEATEAAETACDEEDEAAERVFDSMLRPVHPADDEPSQEPKRFTPLTRKQRRKRERLLAQARKRQRTGT